MIRAYAYDYNSFKSIDKFLRYSKSSQKTLHKLSSYIHCVADPVPDPVF
jgi:hypothetical protein